MKDMDIRGAGNLLGAEQSGFIADIGYETYQKILEEAVSELKETDFKDLFEEENAAKKAFVRDVEIDTDIEMLIPAEYVSNTQERMLLYTELNKLESENDIERFSAKITDRFGKIPPQVSELFEGIRLRLMAKEMGFERIVLKNRKMNCYFVSNPQSAYYETPIFDSIMKFISKDGYLRGFSMKQSKTHLIMTKENVRTLREAMSLLLLVQKAVEE